MTPYVGIAGVTAPEQAVALANQFEAAGFARGGARMGLVGYCITGEMLRGAQAPSPRYARLDALVAAAQAAATFGAHAIHYVAGDAMTPSCASDLRVLFLDTGLYATGRCRVLQLNQATTLVAPDDLAQVKDAMPALEVIVQVGCDDLACTARGALAERLRAFAPYTAVFLIDPSQGRGRSFDVAPLRDVLTELRAAFPAVALGFAGGLSPDNVAARMATFASVSDGAVSVDVESGVRDARDQLDFARTGAFITAASGAAALTRRVRR